MAKSKKGTSKPTKKAAKKKVAKKSPVTKAPKKSSVKSIVKTIAKSLAAPVRQFVILPPRGVRAVLPSQQDFFRALNNMLFSASNALQSFSAPVTADTPPAGSIP